MISTTQELPPDEPATSLGARIALALTLIFVWRQTTQYLYTAVRQYRAHSFPHVVGTMLRHDWHEFGTDGASALQVEFT